MFSYLHFAISKKKTKKEKSKMSYAITITNSQYSYYLHTLYGKRLLKGNQDIINRLKKHIV